MTRQIVRNAQVDGRMADIAIAAGRIVEIGPALAGETLLDAAGGAALPGLHDHHIHLLATAALRQSVRLDDCADAAGVEQRLRRAGSAQAKGAWLRATGYHERMAGPLDRLALDRMLLDRPLRVQHQTGGLWMLNGAALALLPGDDWPEGTERDSNGKATGRFFRCDAWLSARIGRTAPDLAALGRDLAAFGITGVTDASVSTDASAAYLLGDAVRDGRLPLHLTLMSGGPLAAGADYLVGPVKILLDDDRLPTIDAIAHMIDDARVQARAVAVHCVTAGELAITLAAFEQAGSRPGDRIEHGSIIPADAIPVLGALGLTVVTQPGFIATRGERYRMLVDPAEQGDLYRCASLIAAGVPVGGSSDAPYGDPDPWRAIRAAATRHTDAAVPLGKGERIDAARSLDLYLGAPADPGGPKRRLRPGMGADLCILRIGLDAMLADPAAENVAATLHKGRIVHQRTG